MGYKTILAHCDATRGASSRLRVAADIARQHGAHLVGLHIRQPFQVPMFADASAAIDALYSGYEEASRAGEAAASTAFREAIGDGPLSSEWRTATGMADELLIEAGRYADLLVLGQHDPEAPSAAISSDLVERVAMATERPMLVVPYIGATRTPGQNVLLCWNGRREAVRAATGALPLLKEAASVTLLMIDAQQSASARKSATNMSKWLASHGVETSVQHDSSEGSDVGGVILSRAADRDIDLIVMGVYGHSRMREMVLGGASRTMLATMTVPLLVAH